MKKYFSNNTTFKIIITFTFCISLGALAQIVYSESIITAGNINDVNHLGDHYIFQVSAMLCSMMLILLILIWTIQNLRVTSPTDNKINFCKGKITDSDFQVFCQADPTNKIDMLGQSVNMMGINLEKMINEHEQGKTYLDTLNAMNKALETKDDYTANHSANVTRYSLELGRHLGLAEEQLEVLEQGAMLHDLGKIGIPDYILKKADKLDDVERGIIEQHPPMTSSILDPLEKFKQFADIARYHHERWDGKGYPDGLTGEDIPLFARIVAITDTWDAMTSDRVYRKGMDKEQALQIFEGERDRGQWDPSLVDEFVAMHRNNNLNENTSVETAALLHSNEKTCSISLYNGS